MKDLKFPNINFCTTFLLLFAVNPLLAQIPVDQWTDPMREKFALFGDFTREKKYKQARQPLYWLLSNHPNMHKSIYTKGVDTYEAMVTQTEDKQLKNTYEDSVLTLFDLRAEHFGEQPKVLNLKGYSAFNYWQDRPEKYEEMYELYKQIVELNGQDTYNQNVGTYMYLLCKMKDKREELDDAQLVAIHEELTAIVDYNLEKYTQENKPVYIDAWQKTQAYIDSQLEKCVEIDCDFIKNQFLPKFQENPKDTTLAKKIYALAVVGKCIQEDYFLEILTELVKEAPTKARIENLARIHKANGHQDKYIEYMNQALELGGSTAEKADFYLELANEAAKQGSLNQARNYALQAKDLDPNKTAQAYNFIGLLYYQSGTICTTDDPKKAPVYNYVAYMAAYDMFEKAGNTSMMSKAAQYFPTAANIHTINMTLQIGSQIPVGCWIGGTATLRKRPK